MQLERERKKKKPLSHVEECEALLVNAYVQCWRE